MLSVSDPTDFMKLKPPTTLIMKTTTAATTKTITTATKKTRLETIISKSKKTTKSSTEIVHSNTPSNAVFIASSLATRKTNIISKVTPEKSASAKKNNTVIFTALITIFRTFKPSHKPSNTSIELNTNQKIDIMIVIVVIVVAVVIVGILITMIIIIVVFKRRRR